MAVNVDRLIALLSLAVDLAGFFCDLIAILQRYFQLRYVAVADIPSMSWLNEG